MAKKGNNNMKQETTNIFAFDKSKYIITAVGFAIIVIGFILMSGGGTENPEVFSDAIFSTRRITVAPILIIIGFIVEIYAILKKPSKTNQDKAE
jgi:uncharacterized membrane protein